MVDKHPGGRPRRVPTQVIRVPVPLVPAIEKLVEAFKAEAADVEVLAEAFKIVVIALLNKGGEKHEL